MTLFSSLPSQPPPRGDGITRSAIFHRDGVRLVLSRVWGDPKAPRPLFIGHNPSRAGVDREDQTSWRLIQITRSWDAPGFDIGNIYPWVSPYPDDCRAIAVQADHDHRYHADRMKNREAVSTLGGEASMVVACFGDLCGRNPEDWKFILRLIADARRRRGKDATVYCLGTTASGNPRHPMARGRSRVPNDQKPVVWRVL